MCGIAGIVSLTGAPVRDSQRRVWTMVEHLIHRGPDRQGIYLSRDGLVALANTRLSIVDAANDFPVPMVSPDGGTVLTFNGEIFNYRGERSRLEERGAKFRTQSDTEVLLEGLRREGNEFLSRLDGFWGFGFYDVTARRLLIARDLLGERHVFYAIRNGEFVFASEVNPILAVLDGPFVVDAGSLVNAFQFRAAPPGRTLVEGIQRLHAGCGIILTPGRSDRRDIRLQRLQPERHFEFFARAPTEEAVLDCYEEALGEVCRARIPADVGYVATLSGGLDSALVSLFASGLGSRRVKTLFGLSTEAPPRKAAELDELAASRFTSARLGTDHRVFDMIAEESLPLYAGAAASAFDGTFCEGLISYHQLAREISDGRHKVLLLSDGGDDFAGGYEKDRSALELNGYFGRNPIRGQIVSAYAAHASGRAQMEAGHRADLVNWSYLRHEPFRFRPVHGGTTPDVMEALFPEPARRDAGWPFGIVPEDYRHLLPHLDLGQRYALAYATTSVPDHFNLRTDRGTMLASVECRLPLQAVEFVELMIATPEAWRYRGGTTTKYIFRRLIERHIGPEIAWRSKHGFSQPAWKVPRLARRLDFESVIADSDVFDAPPFRHDAREFFLRPEEGRHRWFAYCLAMVCDRLKSRDFTIGPTYRRPNTMKPIAAAWSQ